ncbi:holin [Staphylococcus pseudoxylosus]|uniref:holin n=1 Tax=Staphylococcus pseudoxylosus TaxID=2282419 RepID=UPI00298F0492|nr:holin [Staphylococcus pseudoxylosus]MDW8546369.1 holin [Staphylococcus pseudoxylosus]
MEQIIAFAGIISVITIALTEVVKRTKTIPKNFIPIVSMVIGIVIGGITIFIPEIVSELSVAGRLLAGLISGLMATGIWETFKNKNGKNPNKLGGGAEAKQPKNKTN